MGRAYTGLPARLRHPEPHSATAAPSQGPVAGLGPAHLPGGGGILGGQEPQSAGKSSWGVGQGGGPRGLGSPGGSLGVLRAGAGPSECPLTMTVAGPSALPGVAVGASSAPGGPSLSGGGGDAVPDFSEPIFFFLLTLVKVWVAAPASREETATVVGTLRSSWAVRPARPSSSTSSAGSGPPFLPPFPPLPDFLGGWLAPLVDWDPGAGCATFLLAPLFQAEMRLVGALLGLEAEGTRAGKSSSWKVVLPLAGTGYASASPTGPGAAAAELEDEAEAQRLGKSSSLSFEVGGGRALCRMRTGVSSLWALACPGPCLCRSPGVHTHPPNPW